LSENSQNMFVARIDTYDSWVCGGGCGRCRLTVDLSYLERYTVRVPVHRDSIVVTQMRLLMAIYALKC
jgi:hypothetical protein